MLNLIFPPLCAACSQPLLTGEKVICTVCRLEMPLTHYWESSQNYAVELLSGRFPFEQASALLFFHHWSQYRDLIHRMKYRSRRDIAREMGRIYGRMIRQSPLYDDVELLVPVPLHWTKLISRGFNQSHEICRGMALEMGVACEFRALRRIRATAQQAGRAKSKRWGNVQNAFRVSSEELIRGRHIMLIDDVLTTGSTIESIACSIVEADIGTRISVGSLAIVARDRNKI